MLSKYWVSEWASGRADVCLRLQLWGMNSGRICMGHGEEQGRFTDLGEGAGPKITLLLHLTRGVKIVPGTRVLRKVPSEPEQLLLVASEVEGPEEL